MEITWLGHSCFRLRGRDATVITDPFDESVGYKVGKLSADIVTVSHDHPHHSAAQQVQGVKKVINGPGEFEVSHVFVIGVRTRRGREKGTSREPNNTFAIEIDGVKVCHLGDIGQVPTSEQVAQLGRIDVLLVPVGGSKTLDATGAVEVIGLLEPKIVIPMHYKTEVCTIDIQPLERFLKETGLKDVAPVPKLSVTADNLPEERRTVLLDFPR